MNKISVQHFKDISFADPQKNILYDDVLLALAEQGHLPNTVRLWESPVYCVVLGRTGKAAEDLDSSALKTDNVPVLRRSSGGGTVVQGPGCLNFSFILSKEKPSELADLRRSYLIILEEVMALLADLGVVATFRPISDLALAKNEKKFSGNAQRRGRNFILHHGTILYDFNLSLVSKYLNMPKDVPEYRQGRAHADFINNIPVTKIALQQKFQSHFHLPSTSIIREVSSQENQLLAHYLQDRCPVVKF